MNKATGKGFTLIELVIVLALVALVIAGILIAVSGSQRSRRDTERKKDMATLIAQLEQSASNNFGNLPTLAQTSCSGGGTFCVNYMQSLRDPSTGNLYQTQNGAPAALGQVQYKTKHNCVAGSLNTTGNKTDVAVVILLETKNRVCISNNDQ